MLVQEPVQATIWHALNHYSYASATFLAERLQSEVESEESLLLLATCYFRSGLIRKCYSLLKSKPSRTPDTRFLLAKCCVELRKIVEADALLQPERIPTDYGDASSFAWELRGELCRISDACGDPGEGYKRALALNPFLWRCFESLCDLGEKPEAPKVFQISSLKDFHQCCGRSKVLSLISGTPQNPPSSDLILKSTLNQSQDVTDSTPPIKSFTTPDFRLPPPLAPRIKHPNITPDSQPIPNSIAPSAPKSSRKAVRRFGGLSSDVTISPGFGVLPLENSFSDSSFGSFCLLSPSPVSGSPLPLRTTSPLQLQAPRKVPIRSRVGGPFSQSSNVTNTPPTTSPSPPPPPAGVRRSSRLFGSSTSSVKENSKALPGKPRTIVSRSPFRKSRTSRISRTDTLNERNKMDIQEKSFTSDIKSEEKPESPAIVSQQDLLKEAVNIQKKTADGLMALLQSIGSAYCQLAIYNCKGAIELLEKLPERQKTTPWVLANMGKAYFEMGKYKEAVKYFAQARRKDPSLTYMMEYYSSALWQLGQNVELSALSQSMLEKSRLSPASWCAAGNCLALERDHEAAIKMFQRAIQLDDSFSYAYTLLGLEYMTVDDVQKAEDAFKSATTRNPRDYRAWYGLGIIHYKAEKYGQAENHFKRALSINSASPVVACNLAVVYQAQHRTERALQTVDSAVQIDPKNPTSRYHRASILIAADHHQEALLELLGLKEEIPKESMVFFLLGKVYKKLGQVDKAQKYFNEALDLDPRGANKEVRGFVDSALQRLSTDEESFRSSEIEGDSIDESSRGYMRPQRVLRFSEESRAVDSDESLEVDA